MQPSALVLGGHSFIAPLGNDPRPDDALAAEIVAACLDAGITWFDTTYQPERVALGKALERLGRRREATILAWNFFASFDGQEVVRGQEAYRAHHLEQMLTELQTDHLDVLVVHPVEDPVEHARQEALAQHWKETGRVGRLGTWWPASTSPKSSYDLAIYPCNPTVDDTEERFSHYKSLGWETLGTSPFVRGWELEKRAERSGKPLSVVADELLRWAAFHPNVDRLIVSMRRPEWVAENLASLARGPLSPEERRRL
jgi:aryl-alcohol dehydrogenase-like predicted oxidoreductase